MTQSYREGGASVQAASSTVKAAETAALASPPSDGWQLKRNSERVKEYVW